MTLYALGDDTPEVHADAWVAPDANVIGTVTLSEGSSSGSGPRSGAIMSLSSWGRAATCRKTASFTRTSVSR